MKNDFFGKAYYSRPLGNGYIGNSGHFIFLGDHVNPKWTKRHDESLDYYICYGSWDYKHNTKGKYHRLYYYKGDNPYKWDRNTWGICMPFEVYRNHSIKPFSAL